MIFLIAVFALFGSGVNAQTFPALYDVSNVDSTDVLNIRSHPSIDADIIGTLAPMQNDIEVVAVNDTATWALLNTTERAGWASLAFLTRQPDQDADAIPAITSCFGTEPFWSIGFEDELPILSFMDGGKALPTPLTALRSANRIDRYSFVSPDLSAIVARQGCTDGMSDREFGLGIDVLLTRSEETVHLSGCCTIQP